MLQVNLRTSIHRRDKVRIIQYCGAFDQHCCHGKTKFYSLGIFGLRMSLSTVLLYLCFHVKVPIVSDFHQNVDLVNRIY
jgi:hypothetical protein